MFAHRRPPGAALAVVLACTLASCSAAAPPLVAETPASDRANLLQAARALGPEAAACVAAPPDGWSAAGLRLLAEQAPQWADALGAAAREAGGGATTAPGCSPDDLARDLGRVEALSLRVAEAEADDAVPVAIARAAAAAEAIGRDALAGAAPPDTADLAHIPVATLDALAVAEDQAGFIGEHLATFLAPDEAVRDRLVKDAAAHRVRAEELVALAASPDPRAAVYRLGEAPADAAAVQARWAAAELALASQYAAIPFNAGAEGAVLWQLVHAYSWGAVLPALPFLDVTG
ncbi:MAG: hypothetical protein LBD97_09700 [Bifidobacteriaceae bacterium]|jgi:hypothetical protein|nr:hypothetical protein [Bifidobacteriaceae bacterium]